MDKFLHSYDGINVCSSELDPLVKIKVFVFLCSVVESLNNFVLSINSHLLSSILSTLLFSNLILGADKPVLV